MPITDVLFDQGGAVYNVKAYQAKGDGVTNDTQAFLDAIAAANRPQPNPTMDTAMSGRGSVVYVPQGVYLIRSTLTIPAGVSIRGAGMNTSQIRFELSTADDGLVWTVPELGPFGRGGFLEDIDVIAASYSAPKAVRNLVVLHHWSDFALNRVRLLGASQYNLWIYNSLNITGTHVRSWSAQKSNLWIGSSSSTVTTTCRFLGCYFSASATGPAADVAGLGLAFDACVFEDSGNQTGAMPGTEGYGVRVRGGTATFIAPYFEANRSWDLIAGTDVVAHLSAAGASVTVINPVIMPLHDANGNLVKVTGTGGFRFERGSAFIMGGNLTQSPRPLVFTTQMDIVSAAAQFGANPPVLEGGNLGILPGTVLYRKPITSQPVQAGDVIYGPNP